MKIGVECKALSRPEETKPVATLNRVLEQLV